MPPPVVVPASAPRSVAEPPLAGRQVAIGRHRVTLAARGRLRRLASARESVSLALDRGRARFEVAHLTPAERFEVLAGPVSVEVVGTRFRVERVLPCTTVTVEQGEVRVRAGAAIVARLHAREERRFCPTAQGGIEASSPGEGMVRAALTLIADGGDLARAAARLDRYRREQPDGALGPEVLFHLVRLRRRQGARDEGRRPAAGDAAPLPRRRAARRPAVAPALSGLAPKIRWTCHASNRPFAPQARHLSASSSRWTSSR
jgi:hypothetical protein